MYAEIQGGFTAVKAALELVKAGKGVIDQATMASALYEIQQRLIDAQGAALQANEETFKLSKQIRDLEAQLAAVEEWKTEAQNYELTQVAQGIAAWTEKRREGKLVDAVKLCANCFADHHKSILQMQHEHVNRERSLRCARCKDKLVFRHFVDQS
jgi:flagellar motility protein MotE (MotC chaperone)